MRDRTAKNLSTLHTSLFRLTRGRVGRRLVNNDMLLLSTTGRVSGKTHTIPLLYLRDGTDFVVVASWGGRDNHPEWYANLQCNPTATAQIEGRRIPVEARTADAAQRGRLWPAVVATYDGYREYQGRTDREIPIVILSPTV
ncbi:MAG: nitroreductase family deazaflavin-dependent oxidoreductase [bacterium]|nr:nitroreductase family deazaflavin-dependent oxidoreductase [bacterium]